MDAKNALEAVEAIRSTVPESELVEFDTGLVEQYSLVAEAVGPVAVVAAEEATETKLDPSDVREALFGKLDVAHKGHAATVDALNTGRHKDKFEVVDRKTTEAEFADWLSDEKRLSYITEQMEAGRVPHVIASPNVEIDSKTYTKAARKFGEGQPYSNVYTDVTDQCTPAELSGTDPSNGNKLHFNVVFEDFDESLYGKVAESKAGLIKLQEDAPSLEAPTRLKALTYGFTLRAERGGVLNGPGTADLLYMRDYMVEPKPIGRGLCVPRSVVGGDGGAVFHGSNVEFPYDGRALVG